jgi:dephospho-CoA kinase
VPKPESVVVLSGAIASGKSSFARALAMRLHCPVVSFGGYVREDASSRGLPLDRDSLQAHGQLMVEADPRGFATGFLRRIDTTQPNGTVIVDGLRHVSVGRYLRELSTRHVALVAVVTDREERRRRFVARGDGSGVDFDRVDSHPVENEHVALASMADVVVDGCRDIDESVDRTIANLQVRRPYG